MASSRTSLGRTALLNAIGDRKDVIFGVISPNLVSCKTLVSAFADFLLINTFLNYIEKHSQGIKALSPIPYVRDSPVSGRVFDRAGRSKLMPGVDSGFFVNRQELGRCIHWFMDTKTWPLGAIPAGHEYLMLVSSKDNNRWGQK